MLKAGGCVYIMTNKWNKVLYVGVTASLARRVYEHKTKIDSKSFTARYNCDKLVYYAFYPGIEEAISAEKQLKAGRRKKKMNLVNEINPEWRDLYDSLLG